MSISLRTSMLIVLLLSLATAVATADTKVVQTTHNAEVELMGRSQPAHDTEAVTWLGDSRMSTSTEGSTIIVRLDRKKLYHIDTEKQTYSEVDLPVDLAKLLPPGLAEQMAQRMKFTATVTPSDETKMIGQWKAHRYDVQLNGQMMSMSNTVWATSDVDLDTKTAWEMSKQVMMLQPGMEEMAREMDKIEGFQIAMESTTTMMGAEIKVRTETNSITEEDPPPGTYEVPADYAKTDFNPMARR